MEREHLTVKDLKEFLNTLSDDTILVEGNTCAWNSTKLSYVDTKRLKQIFQICRPNEQNWYVSDDSWDTTEETLLKKPALMVHNKRVYDY